MLRRLGHLWRNLVGRGRVAREIDEEVRGAFEALVEESIAAGQSRDQARRTATRRFGRVDAVVAQVQAARVGAFWDPLWQDVRFGARLLARSPAFAAFAVVSLALGVGATGAVFSLFDALVLRKIAVAAPDQLVVASFGRADRYNYSLPYPHFDEIRQRSTTLAGIVASNPFGRVTVGSGRQAAMAQGVYVSGDYYHVLGLQPAAGRLLQPADDRPGEAVAVISHDYWQRRFGGRADVVGAAVTLNARPFTIVGVEPDGFRGTEVGRPYDISVPMRARELLAEGKPLWNEAFATWIYVIGRLKPGVTLTRAEQETAAIFARVSEGAARNDDERRLARDHQLRLEPAATGNASDLRASHARWLRLLLAVLATVLFLACLNVATLLLSRSDARQRELTTRVALGAGRWRIVRQLLTEALVLATMAGGLGLAVAVWGSRALLRMAVPLEAQTPIDVALDLRLVAFVGGVSLIACGCFGLIPAVRSTSSRRLVTGRQVGAQHRRGLDRSLVVAQVALSLVLLVGAGLFLRTLGRLWSQDTGYDRRDVFMFSVDARLAGRSGAEVPATYDRLLDALRDTSGVQLATASAVRPVSHNYYFVDSVTQVGERALTRDNRIRVATNYVAPGYFATLGIPLVAGRDFDRRDTLSAPKVVIISERMARHFNGHPVGQHIGSGAEAREVIGVAKDMRYANVKDAPREVLYFPMFQQKPTAFGYTPSFELRYAGPVGPLLGAVRETVSRVDAGLEIFEERTLEAQTDASLSRERLLAILTGYVGAFALLLSCIGLYGVMSDRVTLRTSEIGLRLALGAAPRALQRLVLREALLTVGAGAVAGGVVAVAMADLIRSQLFGVEPFDPLAFGLASALLLAMAGLAAYLPARRASRIDPLTALRHE